MTGPAEMAEAYVAPGQALVIAPTHAGRGAHLVAGLTTGIVPANPTEVMVTPTQVRRPWRSTVRSLFQMAVALATLLPFIAAGVYTDGDAPAVVVQVLVVAGAITRCMALPQVERFLADFIPFLAAAPAAIPRNERPNP